MDDVPSVPTLMLGVGVLAGCVVIASALDMPNAMPFLAAPLAVAVGADFFQSRHAQLVTAGLYGAQALAACVVLGAHRSELWELWVPFLLVGGGGAAWHGLEGARHEPLFPAIDPWPFLVAALGLLGIGWMGMLDDPVYALLMAPVATGGMGRIRADFAQRRGTPLTGVQPLRLLTFLLPGVAFPLLAWQERDPWLVVVAVFGLLLAASGVADLRQRLSA